MIRNKIGIEIRLSPERFGRRPLKLFRKKKGPRVIFWHLVYISSKKLTKLIIFTTTLCGRYYFVFSTIEKTDQKGG